ncbi:TBC1 domain family member 5 isoform X2 [Stomoxys calcitrans]|uniref:Rab-GAP TBC domain-containing protein n=1 Tax=Stomoxys calcitrans TaxID=35570 RepID=A0A1I8PIH5_STOCA|nr:TBC1 domain family member 5 isoform X2 [Stomoxys calcitrans]
MSGFLTMARAGLDTTNLESPGQLLTKPAEEEEGPPVKTLNSMERYRNEWLNLLTSLQKNSDDIREFSFDGGLQTSKFRSVYWSLLLRVLSEDSSTWREQKKQQRQSYDILRKEFVKNPHENFKNHIQDDDPLSQSSKSVWNQYFSDQELFGVIRQDVIRTFPGVDFFRKPAIQNIMSNILFYYARDHPYMCYRQGMHEILAPVLFVLYGDHQSLLHYIEIANNLDIDKTLLDVINPSFLEADAYFLFSRIMSCIESYYRVCDDSKNSNCESPNKENGIAYTSEAEVVGQLNFIRDKILAKEDLHLHNYLKKLDIPLHLFGIRWLRLLFGREFALLDLLILWDAIFADSDRFDLPNYILVAMLIRIRHKLLLSDYTTCLTYLMRYPQNVDVNLILRHALHMKMPKKYDRPTNAFIYFTMPSAPRTQYMSSSPKSNAKRDIPSQEDPGRATCCRSLEANGIRAMEKEITLMQTRNAVDDALLAKFRSASEENGWAMDGYKSNVHKTEKYIENLQLLRLELKNAQTVVTVARSKLEVYLHTLRQHVSQPTPPVCEALDGIEELCKFLDVTFIFPSLLVSGPIDQALEANEQQNFQGKTELSNKHSRHFMPQSPDLLSTSSEIPRTTTYERPDNGFMNESSHILGNIKEIELIPIISGENLVDQLDGVPGDVISNKTSVEKGRLPIANPLCLESYSKHL